MLDKDPFTEGMIEFEFMVNNQTLKRKFDINNPVFGEEWELKSFDFGTVEQGGFFKEGDLDFMNSKGNFPTSGAPGGVAMISINNLETKHVPEPSSVLALSS